ncbi:unnamed protein product [Aspergillus niger]|nr:hypothetical protein CBS12448_10877 [Aspergillus niger]KAI2868277.1 hypothetical protein CBS11852_11367 [Aspergillus niger]KAI3014533.1 hypothetical protein CBS147347_11454 [Aspergillus niger]SPB49750.1 unnamed protein product [Aspergillus niger]
MVDALLIPDLPLDTAVKEYGIFGAENKELGHAIEFVPKVQVERDHLLGAINATEKPKCPEHNDRQDY